MGLFLFILIVAFIGGIVGAIIKIRNDKKHKENAQSVFDNLPDFKADNYYLSPTSGQSIGFDNTRKKICFLDRQQNPFVYDYSKILQSEIIVDGETILKQSTTGTIGRSILGGVLSGGVGAIIGGTTGTKTQTQNISSIDLKVIINDTKTPVFKINFLNLKTKKGSFIYKKAYGEVENWHGILSGLIRQGNTESENTKKEPENISVADEIKKMRELLDSGVLTNDEFEKQKTKLLGN